MAGRAMLGQWWAILRDTAYGLVEDKAPRLGAALAFYSVLALAPLIILVTPVAGLLLGEGAQAGVTGELEELIGPQGTTAVRDVLNGIRENHYALPPGRAAQVLGVIVLLFGASGVFAELQDALDTIWEVAPKPGHEAIWAYVKQRFISFAMVLGIGFLLIVSLLLSAALSRLQAIADRRVQELAWLWALSSGTVSFVVVTFLFAMMFKVLPDVKVPWRPAVLGAAITSLLFAVGRYVIGTYLGKASIGTAYGAAGSMVVLLVWVYYSAQIVYLGAEFTKVYTRRTGEYAPVTEIAVPVTEEARAQEGIVHEEVVEAIKQVVEKKATEGDEPDATR